jgi:hypothetical protein
MAAVHAGAVLAKAAMAVFEVESHRGYLYFRRGKVTRRSFAVLTTILFDISEKCKGAIRSFAQQSPVFVTVHAG